MIRADRVRLDGLIHQWEEESKADPRDDWRGSSGYIEAKAECAQQLRAALLVLGDARPLVEEK